MKYAGSKGLTQTEQGAEWEIWRWHMSGRDEDMVAEDVCSMSDMDVKNADADMR
jgi:hypothetical protein